MNIRLPVVFTLNTSEIRVKKARWLSKRHPKARYRADKMLEVYSLNSIRQYSMKGIRSLR